MPKLKLAQDFFFAQELNPQPNDIWWPNIAVQWIWHHAYLTGLYSVIGPVYVSEMSPSHIRGKLGLINYILNGGGVVGGAIAGGLFSIDSKHAFTFGWRCDYNMTV